MEPRPTRRRCACGTHDASSGEACGSGTWRERDGRIVAYLFPTPKMLSRDYLTCSECGGCFCDLYCHAAHCARICTGRPIPVRGCLFALAVARGDGHMPSCGWLPLRPPLVTHEPPLGPVAATCLQPCMHRLPHPNVRPLHRCASAAAI